MLKHYNINLFILAVLSLSVGIGSISYYLLNYQYVYLRPFSPFLSIFMLAGSLSAKDWSGFKRKSHGFSTEAGQSMKDITVHRGNVIQKIINIHNNNANRKEEHNMSQSSRQSIENAKSKKGGIRQSSDISDAQQQMSSIEADTDIEQEISSEKQELSIGKYAAKGKIAVIVLGIIVILVLFIKYGIPIFQQLSK